MHDWPHDDIFEILDLVFDAVPGEYLAALLHERLASIRAAYETLLDLAGQHKQRDAFRILVQIGATQGWLAMLAISRQGHLLLYYAASMNLVSVLRTLLDHGCRPDSLLPALCTYDFPTAIVAALKCGNVRCAELLLDCCDVNKKTGSGFQTNFENFLMHLGDIGALTESGLKMFIRAGADLERLIKLGMIIFAGRTRLFVADYMFYFHRSFFYTLFSESPQVQRDCLSRAGILHSLEGGLQDLESYVASLTPRLDQRDLGKVFQQLILEQFFLQDLHDRKIDTDLETVRGLSSFGTRFGASIKAVLGNFPRILHSFVQSVQHDPDTIHVEAALYLVENGATVTGKVLSWMSRLPDMRPLDLALGNLKNPEGLEIAIVHAAERNNFEAIERLIHAGAKLDADVRGVDKEHRGPVSIIARIISSEEQISFSQMLEFLVMRGAPLRLSKSRPHLHHLLQHTLDMWGPGHQLELLERVQYIAGLGYDLRHSPFPTAPLLEACRSTQVFEYLYRNGAQLQPGSPLAIWIDNDGGIELCREMLKAGADPNAYTQYSRFYETPSNALQMAVLHINLDAVELLLLEGAEVNAPAKGQYGSTALQAICLYQPYSSEDQQRQLRIIRLLLDHGADVNAAPARKGGKTALQGAAASGDLAAAKLLLVHNPMADVNAPPCEYMVCVTHGRHWKETTTGTALDYAAEKGRIDMVKLLLSYNALSHDRGETGYDGAIQCAREYEYFAIEYLIIQHAEDARRSGTRADLSQPWKDYHAYYGGERGADWDSECSEDEERSNSDSEVNHPGLYD